MRSRWLRMLLCIPVIVLACAAGILGVKSLTEHLLYAQPFMVRAAKNFSAFVADAVMLILSLPVCELLDKQARKIFPELVRQ